MSAYEDYWLFPSAHTDTPDDTIPAVPTPFLSLEDARAAATELGGVIDIFGAPARGGTLRLLEHVEGRKGREKQARQGPRRPPRVGSFRREGPGRP